MKFLILSTSYCYCQTAYSNNNYSRKKSPFLTIEILFQKFYAFAIKKTKLFNVLLRYFKIRRIFAS